MTLSRLPALFASHRSSPLARVERACAAVCVWAWLALGASACTESIGLPADTGDGLRYPIALVADPSGKQIFALGANFDRLYRAGRLRTIDTATDTWVVGSNGQPVIAEVPSFGGNIAVEMSHGATATAQRLFVPSRDDDSMSIVDVGTGTPRTLTCGADPSTGICDSHHRIAASAGVFPVGDDPFAVALSDTPTGRKLVHVAAATNGQLSLFDYDPSQPVMDLRALDSVSMPAGLHTLLISPLSGRAYVTSTRTSAIQTYRIDPTDNPDRPWRIQQEPGVVLPASGAADYGRGMALSSDQSRLYVAWRSPAALQIVDIVPESAGVPFVGVASPGAPNNRLVDTIELGAKPSLVAVAPTGPGGRDLVYISCFGEDAIWVVDPVLRTTVAQIPMRLAVTPAGGSPTIVRGAPFALTTVNVPGRGWTLYAALFSVPPGRDHEVVVIPLESTSPKRHVADHVVTLPGA